MIHKLAVLVTGAGAPGIAGTVYALKDNPEGRAVSVVGVDARPDAVGRHLVDEFRVVPMANSNDFLSELLSVAKETQADVILPQVTSELTVLAQGRPEFEALGIAVAISSPRSVLHANDKLEVLYAARAMEIPFPEFHIARDETELRAATSALGYPASRVVVKPRTSNGMRGLRILTDKPWTVDQFLNEKPDGVEISLEGLIHILRRGDWPELLVTAYMPGAEYTVDVYRGRQAQVAIPRLRQQIRSGITFHAAIDLREDLISQSLVLADYLDLRFAVGFQFKCDEHGVPRILECNPRIQGSMVAGVMAGFNMIYYAALEATGSPAPSPAAGSLRSGFHLERYWGAIGYDEFTSTRI